MKEIDLPDGTVGEFPDTMPDAEIQGVLQRQFGGPAASTPAAPTPPPAAARPTVGPADQPARIPGTSITLPNIPSPLTMAGKALPILLSPVKKAFDVAGQADVAAGIKTPEQAASRAQAYTNVIPPMLTGILSGGASVPVQAAMQMGTTHAMQEGGMEPKRPFGPIDLSVATSGAVPFIASGIGRLARGLGRTATRIMPGRFQAAQAEAQGAAGDLTQSLRPETAPANLFRGARAAGGEVIPASNIQRVAADVAESIGQDPQTPGLQVARAFADKLTAATSGGSVDLKSLMQLRRDLGGSLGRAPEVAGLYGAVLSDLEAAAAAGGPGANMATSALQAFKQDLGANRFSAMVEASTKDSVAGGRGLNIATLRKAVTAIPKNGTTPELLRLLGPEKYQTILNFIDEYRALPPAMAYTMMNVLATSVAGIAGALTGFGIPAGAGILGTEILRNAAFAGRNPAALNAPLITGGEMLRALLTPQRQNTGVP